MPHASSSLPYVAAAAVLAVILTVLLVGNAVRAAAPAAGKTRAALLDELAGLEAAQRRHPQDPEATLAYARGLYQSGEFEQAFTLVRPLAQQADAERAARELVARLAYLTGRYRLAARTYQQLVDDPAASRGSKLGNQINQAMAYYQLNAFDRIRQIRFPRGVQLPQFELVKAFDQPPYQLSWPDEQVVRVPFLMSDPLPLVTVEFNGHPVTVIFDTGADLFILDPEIAAELGIKDVSSAVGAFGGGKPARFGFAKLDSVRVGGLTFNQVPIMTLPTKRFSQDLTGGKHTVGGFIGTAALRQCLTTVDYQRAQMVFRPRDAAGRAQLTAELAGREVVEVPFALEATHMMMARGSLNDREGLTFFVDSGLASTAAFSGPRQTLEFAGIPIPETRPPQGSGGGGGPWASGIFPIERLALGPLVQTNLQGEYGSRAPNSYWEHGFIQDGLISHNFLRKYASWTLDFDRMRYLFVK